MNTETSLIFHWASVLFGGKHFCKASGQMLAVQQEICCSCGCINWWDRACSLHKGRQTHHLCPSIPVSFMSALTSPFPCVILTALARWLLCVWLLRNNSVYGGHAAFSELYLSTRVNPSTWIHSFPLSTAGNFLFITPAVFFLAIIFSPTHPC